MSEFALKLREYVSADLDGLVNLWERCGLTRPWNDPKLDIERSAETPTSTVLIGTLSGQIASSVMVGHDGHRGWMYYLAVASEFRGRGFGKRTVEAAELWLRQEEAVKSMLLVRKSNTGVIGFYESIGYQESDVVTMERWLTPDGKRPGSGQPGSSD